MAEPCRKGHHHRTRVIPQDFEHGWTVDTSRGYDRRVAAEASSRERNPRSRSTVRAVTSGKSFFSPAIARLMLDDYVKQRSEDRGVVDRYESLSEREREVFQLIAEGNANKDIAVVLGISPSTVETHRARIMEKLDVHSAVEIVLYAVRRGIIR